ncbi:S-layer homology domain-containing protein, partial [Caldisalinibacter kiritimatiensis]|uniref:S-layer homology domain-containing protein n=1 Tax=Caldisalinibacter kiritimatiensis TaxID=1304284 RepID=UPI00054DA383
MKKIVSILMFFVLFTCLIPLQNTYGDNNENFNEEIMEILNKENYNEQELFNAIEKELEQRENHFKQIANRFSDMGNHWADVTVGKLVELGILDGYGDGTFKPNNTITRAEFSKVVRTSLKLDL